MYGVGQGMTTGCAGKADLSLGITRLCHRMSMRECSFSSCIMKSFENVEVLWSTGTGRFSSGGGGSILRSPYPPGQGRSSDR